MSDEKKISPREFKTRFRMYKNYDTVSKLNIEIKCTPYPKHIHYDLGVNIQLEDGLYIGYEGWFVVYKGKVLISGNKIYDKWGGERPAPSLLMNKNIYAATQLELDYILEDENIDTLL